MKRCATTYMRLMMTVMMLTARADLSSEPLAKHSLRRLRRARFITSDGLVPIGATAPSAKQNMKARASMDTSRRLRTLPSSRPDNEPTHCARAQPPEQTLWA